MHIHWHPGTLPENSGELGHGLGLFAGRYEDRPVRIIAFVDEFAWYHHGTEPIVKFDPTSWPADRAQQSALRGAFESGLRERRLSGDIDVGDGYHILAHA